VQQFQVDLRWTRGSYPGNDKSGRKKPVMLLPYTILRGVYAFDKESAWTAQPKE